MLLIDRRRFDSLQFARKHVRERVSEVNRQCSGANGRSIVKLYLVRLKGCSNLSPSLQFSNQIDERGTVPWFGNSTRLLQRNDVSGCLFDDTEAVKLQLTDDRRLPRTRSPCQYEPSHARLRIDAGSESRLAALKPARTGALGVAHEEIVKMFPEVPRLSSPSIVVQDYLKER